MSVGVEALFTSALGLQVPWVVEEVKLDTAKRRIDFEIGCQGKTLACPACKAAAQPVHDRLRRSWAPRHFVWKETFTMTAGSRARWACGQVACRPVHMSTGRVLNEEVV